MGFGVSAAKYDAGMVWGQIVMDQTPGLRSLSQFSQALAATEKTGERHLGKIRAAATGVSTAMLALGAVASVGMLGLEQLAASAEQTEMAFTQMLGSVAAAQAKITELRDFAAKTPFEFTQLTDASRRLMAFGFQAEELIPILTDVGDAVAAMGGSGEMIERVTRALGQIQAKGRVQAQEMLQLMEAGIPAWRYLAEAMGTSTQAVMKLSEKGLLPAKQAIDAIRAGMRGDFGGMMAQQAETAAGQLSNLKDEAARLATALGMSLLPTFKEGIKFGRSLTDMLAGLTEAQKRGLGQVLLYGTAVTLAVAGLLKLGVAVQTVTGWIAAGVALQRTHTAALAQNTAAQLANADATVAKAEAALAAAGAAVWEAKQLVALAATTAGGTAADVAFAEAELAKATASWQAAYAATGQARAQLALAQSTRAGTGAFLGLHPVLLAVVVVIGAAAAAWAIYEHAQHAAIEAAEAAATQQEAELTRLDAAKGKRQVEATQLTELANRYDTLRNTVNRTAGQQGELESIKRRLAARMVSIREELGLQAQAWDGTRDSINKTVEALKDYSQIERQAALARAKRDELEKRAAALRTRQTASDARYGQNAVSNLGMRQFASRLNETMYGFMPNLSDAEQAALSLAQAKAEDSYWQYVQAIEARKQIEAALQNPHWQPTTTMTGTNDGHFTVSGGTSTTARQQSVREELEARLAAIAKEAAAAQRLGQTYDAVGERYKAFSAALTTYFDKGVKLQDARVLYVLRNLQTLLPQVSAAVKTARISEVLRGLRDGLAGVEAETRLFGESVETLRARQNLLKSTALSLVHAGMEPQSALVKMLITQFHGATEAVEDFTAAEERQQARLAAWEQVMASLTALPGQIIYGALERQRRAHALLEDEAAARARLSAAQADDLAAAELALKHRQAELATAWLTEKLAGLQRKSAAFIAEQEEQRRRAVIAVLQAQGAVADAQERITTAVEKEAAARERAAAAIAKARADTSSAYREMLRGRGAWTLDDDLRLTQQQQEVALAKFMAHPAGGLGEYFRLQARLEDLRRQLDDEAAALAAQAQEPVLGPRASDAYRKHPDALGLKEATIDPLHALLKKASLGDALWNYARDRKSVGAYFRKVSDDFGKSTLAELWRGITSPQGDTGGSSQFDVILGKLGVTDPQRLARQAGLAAVAAGSLQTIARGEGGFAGGAMSGVGLAASVAELAPKLGVGGPVGLAIGAVLGGILGSREERKRAEREARRLQEEQLAELRRIRNGLQAVTDYFRSMNLHLLPSRQTLAGAGALATSYAVQSSRVAR